jgi:Sulfotransferase family
MIISHSRQFIFVHVPKTGGTSITLSFLKQLSKNDIILGCLPPYDNLSHESRKKGGLHKHSKAYEIKNELGDIYNEYFSFAFVRNPFDLILSQYYWWKTTNVQWDKAALKVKAFVINATYEQFILSGKGYRKRRQFPFLYDQKTTNDLMAISNDVLKNHLKKESATDYIKEYRKTPLNVNQLYRIESFSNDLKQIESKIEIKLKRMHKNISNNLRPHKDYRSFYSDESKAIIEKFALVDLILFDYAF